MLALRAYRLSEPLVVPFEPEYCGCTSWVDVHGLPDDPSSLSAEPALSDESFTARRKLLEQQLGRALEPVDGAAGISLR